MFNGFMLFLFMIMVGFWGIMVWDYKKNKSQILERLERKYRAERIIECKELLGERR